MMTCARDMLVTWFRKLISCVRNFPSAAKSIPDMNAQNS